MIRTREWTPEEIAEAYERAEDRRLAQVEAAELDWLRDNANAADLCEGNCQTCDSRCGRYRHDDREYPTELDCDDDRADRAAADWYQWRNP